MSDDQEAVSGAINCRLCGQPIPVQFTRAANTPDNQVQMRVIDTAPIAEHMDSCTPAAKLPEVAMVKGDRRCTMCGTRNATCMELLRRGKPCCGLCGDGNTHPTAAERTPCDVWGQTHGA